MDTGELTKRLRKLEEEHENREIPGVDQAGVVLFDVPEKIQTSVVNKDAAVVKTATLKEVFDNQERTNARRILYEQVQTTTGNAPSGTSGNCIRLRGYVAKPGTTEFMEMTRSEVWNNGESARYVQGHVAPIGNNKFSMGTANAKWTEVFATNGSINTSDERLKTGITDIPDEVLDAWEDVGFVQFQMLDAVEKKGDSARLHTGLIAQRVKAVFEAHGLDAFRYGLLCHDAWEGTPQLVDQHGDVVEPERQAGDVYSLRYEEALCLEAAYQRRRADRMESRLASLEALMTNSASKYL